MQQCTLALQHLDTLTSISETIRKCATRRSPNCVRKTKRTFCGTPVSVSLPKFCEKLPPRTKFHWNRDIGCWVMAKKTILKWRPSAILNFKILIFDDMTVSEFQICIYVPNFIKIGWFLVKIWRFHDFQDGAVWRISAILNFRGP